MIHFSLSFLLLSVIHQECSSSMNKGDFRLKNAALEIEFDFNFKSDKPMALMREPLLLLVHSFGQIAFYLNFFQDLKIMQFHRDLSHRFGGYWNQLLSTKTCINHMHEKFISPDNNSTHFYIGIRNKERIVVHSTGAGVCVEQITHDVYPEGEAINVSIDTRRAQAISNWVLSPNRYSLKLGNFVPSALS